MKKLVPFLVIVLPMTLFVAGCKNPVDVGDISLNFNERVTVAATFANGNGLATIGNLRVTWDGQALQESAPSMPVEQVTVSRTRYGRERGSHRLSFQILARHRLRTRIGSRDSRLRRMTRQAGSPGAS